VSRLSRNKTGNDIDVEIDLVPIMNMFLVLIPFLLMSAAFFQLKAINTSVPVLAETKTEAPKEKEEIKVRVIMQITPKGIDLSVASPMLGNEELTKWDNHLIKEDEEEYPLDQLLLCLQNIKKQYPASDTLIVIPDKSILYNTIIQAMDTGRYCQNEQLFPNVVLSGKVV